MAQLTAGERRRVSALCHRAWSELLVNRSKKVSVSLEDILLLVKAGARRVIYGKLGNVWHVEVDLYGHIFLYQDEYYFYVPERL